MVSGRNSHRFMIISFFAMFIFLLVFFTFAFLRLKSISRFINFDDDRATVQNLGNPNFRPQTITTIPTSTKEIDLVNITTSFGSIYLRLFSEKSPNTVSHFKELVQGGFYQEGKFYRAVPGFVLQGGGDDERYRAMKKGTIDLEYSIPNYKTMVNMARRPNPNTATHHFSINIEDNSKWLGPGGSDQYGYSVFAQVIGGWELVQIMVSQSTLGDQLQEPIPFLQITLSRAHYNEGSGEIQVL